jgi:Zn finger protein HypA/HybF involved in hydrogenase expression
VSAAVAPLHRTLEQELVALLRGASLECLACGEFVLHEGPNVRCPECGFLARGRIDGEQVGLECDVQAG